jgi:hypothetical protein
MLERSSAIKVVRELLRKRLKEISAGLAATVRRFQRLELGTKGRIAAVAISVAIVLWLCTGIGTVTVF